MSDSYVYVLVYPDLNAIKVGKADVILNRVQQLSHWGRPDYEKSYQIKVDKSDVYKLEGALHLVLSPFKKKMNKNDGYTEFFEISALKEIERIEHIFPLVKSAINFEKDINKLSLKNKSREVIFKNRIKSKIEVIKNNLLLIENISRCIFLIKKRTCDFDFKYDGHMVIKSRYLSLIKQKLVWLSAPEISGSIISASNDNYISINIKAVIDFLNHSQLAIYTDILLCSYNYLKKDLPNESELPIIKLSKNGKLEIQGNL
ncbi:TPA: GIY-YIG nuclease family protein [Morganella morganii]|nr:GIY-YIG nuclease family protein [Morganella morganii]HDF2424502.1 GIY-YIG nuclease family protein [Morganella morganii]